MKYRILLLLLCLWLPMSALAQENKDEVRFDYKEPSFLLRSNDRANPPIYEPENLKEIIRKANEKNDASLQYSLGFMYERGFGVLENWNQAAEWYEKAAENEHVDAMIALARLYKNGGPDRGIPRNILSTLRWFNLAAKKGNPHAYYELGLLYEAGDGVFPNDKKALAFYKRAAEAGVTNAHIKVGLFYQHGRGTKKNLSKAVEQYKAASQTKDPMIRKALVLFLGKLYADVADLQENEADAIEWFKKAGEFNDEASQIKVADYYHRKLRDFDEARKWYLKAADTFENVYAMDSLGYFYSNGLSVEQDYCKARDWYKRAAERGSAEAAWNMGNIYFNGWCGAKNITEANIWYQRSETLKQKSKRGRN